VQTAGVQRELACRDGKRADSRRADSRRADSWRAEGAGILR
jgi:hypothetical protein